MGPLFPLPLSQWVSVAPPSLVLDVQVLPPAACIRFRWGPNPGLRFLLRPVPAGGEALHDLGGAATQEGGGRGHRGVMGWSCSRIGAPMHSAGLCTVNTGVFYGRG